MMDVLRQHMQTSSEGGAEEEKHFEALSSALQQLVKDSMHAEFRESSSAQELMCSVLQVMGRLVQRVQACSDVDRGPVACDDAAQGSPGDLIGGMGKEGADEVLLRWEKRLDEVLLCLKLLRNMCAGVERNQDVMTKEGLLSVRILLVQLKEASIQTSSSKETITLVARTALQMLGNVCVMNLGRQALVWNLYFSEVFLEFLSKWPPEAADIVCMVIHTCVGKDRERRLELATHGAVLAAILNLISETRHQESSLEWVHILLSSLLKNGSLLTIFSLESAVLNTKCRLMLMDFLLDELNFQSHDQEGPTHKTHVAMETEWLQEEELHALVREFCSCWSTLEGDLSSLQKVSVTGKCEDGEISDKLELLKKLLSLLCALSSEEPHSVRLQQQEGLLAGALGVLTLLSKADGTIGSVQNTSQLCLSQPTGEEPKHPLFGVKRDLVRLVGNLCHQSRRNQSILNSLEGIQLVLNHCSIDHYNPYIAQWSIWATRNFCKDNLENQQVVASIEHQQQGGVSSEVLEECGLQVEVGPDGHLMVCKKQQDRET